MRSSSTRFAFRFRGRGREVCGYRPGTCLTQQTGDIPDTWDRFAKACRRTTCPRRLPMRIRRSIQFAGFLLLVSSVVLADRINGIPFTGSATQGFAQTEGDFKINGPGLSLTQSLPDG